jgi:hypothetical protein
VKKRILEATFLVALSVREDFMTTRKSKNHSLRNRESKQNPMLVPRKMAPRHNAAYYAFNLEK